MKKLFLFFLLVTCSLFSFSQNLSIVKDTWKCGLMNEKGEIVVPCAWEAIIPVKGTTHYYVVKLGEKYGVIDDTGEVILDAVCSYVIPRLFGDKMLINVDGSVVSTTMDAVEIQNPFDMYYTKAGTSDKVFSSYVRMAKVDWLPHDDFYSVGGKWGILNLRENIPSISPAYDILQTLPNEQRYIGLGYTYGETANFNIYDFNTGSFIYDFETKKKNIRSSMHLLSGGYAMINEALVHFVGGENEELVSRVSNVVDINEQYVLVISRKHTGVFDKKKAEFIIEDVTTYNTCKTSSDKFAVGDKSGKWYAFEGNEYYETEVPSGGVVEYVGDFSLVTTPQSPYASIWSKGKERYSSSVNKYVPLENGKILYLIDDNSNLIRVDSRNMSFNVIYSGCLDFDIYPSIPEYAKVAIPSGWSNRFGIVDLSNSTVLVPFEYDDICIFNKDLYYTINGSVSTMRSLSEPDFTMDFFSLLYDSESGVDRCWVWKDSNGKAALYDMSSRKFLTEAKYAPQVFLKDSKIPIMVDKLYYPVTNGNKWGVINKNGEVVTDLKYDNIFPFVSSEGFFPVSNSNGKFGYVNPYTRVELPCVFDDIGKYTGGVCPVCQNGKWGLADASGNVLIFPKYDSIYDFYKKISWLKKDSFPLPITFAITNQNYQQGGVSQIEWIDITGKKICVMATAYPAVNSIIPDGLWDF